MRRSVLLVLILMGALAVFVAGVRTAQVITGESAPAPERTDAPSASPSPSGSVSRSGSGSGSASTAGSQALTVRAAGEAFLNGYLEADGRVARHDQGGDTVSEGQAYAMLVAAALHDRQRFDAAWAWTKQNLVRRDGLLAWRWQEGRIIDEASASDADLDAARALVVAGRAFGDDQLMAEGVRLGRAVLDRETVMTERGRILVSGSWARRPPYSYNPSYASPAASAVLAEASGDQRWGQLDAGTRAVTKAMLERADLPPDWAQVHADGHVDAMPGAAGRGNEGVRYGYDGARMPLRFAESCHPADVSLGARLTNALDRFPGDPAARDLGGAPLVGDESVVGAAGKAGALAAAGDTGRATAQLLNADRIQQVKPTYYGAAWNVLGRLMLTTDELGGCPRL